METLPNEIQPQEAISKPPIKRKRRRAVKASSTKVPQKVYKRIKKGVRHYAQVIKRAEQEQVNESDTSNIVNDMLSDFWGFDKFFDVTTEYKIRGQYADYGVKLNNKIVFFIEVKAINVRLNDNHIFQVTSYAANEGVEWVVLTNGRIWRLYHLGFGRPIERELVMEFDVLDGTEKPNEKIEKMVCLSKESFKKKIPFQLWNKRVALSLPNIQEILLSESFLRKLRTELRKKTGYLASEKDLEKLLGQAFKSQLKKKD